MKVVDQFAIRRNKMVQEQILQRGIEDVRLLQAFREIPRHAFVPEDCVDQAYYDHPLPIGNGQTISQPYIVALMTHCLKLSGKEKVLEIGTGSGYQTAILAALAEEIYTVELIAELSKRAARTLDSLGLRNTHLFEGDGSSGLREHQPYDRIIITAAVPSLSDEIKDQLNEGGKIVAPIGDRWRQQLEVWKRKKTGFVKETILPVVFVPLRGKYGWQD